MQPRHVNLQNVIDTAEPMDIDASSPGKDKLRRSFTLGRQAIMANTPFILLPNVNNARQPNNNNTDNNTNNNQNTR